MSAPRCDINIPLIPNAADVSTLLQDHTVSEAAEDQRASAKSHRGLWSADGPLLYGEGGKRRKVTF